MVSDPLTYGPIFAKAGADFVSIHVEATPHLHKGLTSIRDLGVKAGAAINPSTPLSALEPCLPYMDFVNIMGVNPGFSGQPFIPETTLRAEALSGILKKMGLTLPIEIDGGVTDQNAGALARAGVGILVSGSHLFKASDYAEVVTTLRLQCRSSL
jgi:ribulose-phosphate 3-epimerase